MFTSGELERVSMVLDEPMKELEMRIMQDVVRRIKINGEITAAADWQINRLQQLGMSKEEVNAAIQEALSYSDEDMNELYSKVIGAGYTRDRALYEATGTPFIPFEENGELQQLISSVSDQTNQTLHNITQSLGFAERGTNGKISFTPLADFYQKTLDSAMLDISSGAFDYNTVLKRTVKAMTDSGLRTVDYASGHSNRVDVAARRAVMTGMTQLTAKVNEQNAEQLETDMFEVSWHGGARPEHQVWQGKWYTKAQLETVCGLGTVTGLCGANCYHEYNPVIPGISEPTYTAEELEELNRQENEPVEWEGKQYTKYEALQRQRRLETTMRAQRQEMALLKKGEADEDDLINCRAKYRVTSAEYTRFSEAMGLPQQRERVTADGLGNIMQGKYTKGSGKPSPVQVPAVGAKVTDKVTAEERKELLSRDRITLNSSEKENDKFSERSKVKSDEPITIVKKADIESPKYRKQFEYFDESPQVKRTMYQESRDMLNHRTGTKFEDLSFIGSNTGDFITRTDFNEESKVEPSKRMYKMLRESEPYSIIAIHNHPKSATPSIDDIGCAYERKYKYGVIACHNGSLYRYSFLGKFDTSEANLSYVDMLLDNVNRIVYNKEKLADSFETKLADALNQLKGKNLNLEVFLWN